MKSLSTLIKEADTLFSQLIRLQKMKDGQIICFTCGRSLYWKEAQCGHIFPRGNMASRFATVNAEPVCKECNCHDPNHQVLIQEKVKLRYGKGYIEMLERLAHSTVKLMPFELEEIIADFKSKIAVLKKQKGL